MKQDPLCYGKTNRCLVYEMSLFRKQVQVGQDGLLSLNYCYPVPHLFLAFPFCSLIHSFPWASSVALSTPTVAYPQLNLIESSFHKGNRSETETIEHQPRGGIYLG